MPDALVEELAAATRRGAVADDLATRLQWAGDASIYLLVPRVVVFARHGEDIAAVLRVAAARGVPVCLRAGGTSLSGQAVTDGILLVVSRHLRAIRVHPGAELVSAEAGAVGSWVNAALAPHGRRIGPDPASIQAAEIGGIVANNASGMCCGVAENSYRTVTGLDLVLADGWRVDTGAPGADALLRDERPAIHAGLAALAAELRADAALAARVAEAFRTKNTVGYGLNALLDEDEPVRILQKLVVGSEGTLAAIVGATFRTLPAARLAATAWLVFADVEAACAAVAGLAATGAAAIELLDAVALRRVAAKLPEPPPAGEPAALLVEWQAQDEEGLAARLAAAAPALQACALAAPARLSRDAGLRAQLWAIRKGLFPSVGAVRRAGTAVVIEDITFPVARLAEGVRALRESFAGHGYDDAVIFGHAKDGNLHFTLTPDLAQPEEVARYDRFLRAMAELVIARGGHLKAEHGTGRNMAPFVEAQWGPQAVALMRRIKRLLDPAGILNPGVLLSEDREAHLRHLKTLPPADRIVDRCIECGFCEPVCPSRDAAHSPRQRIAALRWRARGGEAAAALRATWRRDVLDRCAADGMCATACPVGIDTGELVRAERAAERGSLARALAGFAADRFALVAAGTRTALRLARLWGGRLPGRAIRLPPAAAPAPRSWPRAQPGAPTIVYLPSCLARTLGGGDLRGALARLCAAAGVGVALPAGVAGLCCGQPFDSKGFPAAGRRLRGRTMAAVLAAARAQGASAWVTDTSTCGAAIADDEADLPQADVADWRALRRLDASGLVVDLLLPRLAGRIAPADLRLATHATCADLQQGREGALHAAASALGDCARLPSACCGMAGDKGWSAPDLPAAGAAREAAAVRAAGAGLGLTTSPTCALALAAASGIPYRHLWCALAEALREPVSPARAGAGGHPVEAAR